MFRRRNIALLVGTLLVVLIAGWAATRRATPTEPAAAPPVADRQLLPDLALTAYDGQTVRLRDLRGTPLVVNSWAAWCPFCVKELPDFAAVQTEFGNRVKIVAINREETLEVARGFTDKLGASEKLFYLLDPQDEFYRAIGGFTMPETLFVNAEGRIVFQKRGVMTREEIRQRVTELVHRGKQ